MATYKQNDTITAADGTIWRRTAGGNWRAENGTNKGKLYSKVVGPGDPTPAAPGQPAPGQPGAGPAPAPAAPPIPGAQGSSLPESPTVPAPNNPAISNPQLNDLSFDSGEDAVNSGLETARASTAAGNLLTNPNQINDFGASYTTIDPLTGQPTVRQVLSEGNQGVVRGTQNAAVNSSNVLSGLLQGGNFAALTDSAGNPAPESSFSKALYSQLTNGVDEQQRQEQAQLDQTLRNRGIPVGSQAYTNEMQRFDKRYDDIKSNAKNQAVTGSVGAATNLLQPLTNTGTSGYYNPSFQGFNSVGYNGPDTNSIYGTLTGTKNTQIAANASMKNASLAAEAAKSASEANKPKTNSPFQSKPPQAGTSR